MPPRSSRRGRGGGGGGGGGLTPSPIGRNTPSVSSARSSSSRLGEAVRSPLLAKYSTSYGSPLTQLPDRNLISGGGTISSAAAIVFKKVSRDNRMAQRRRNAANSDTTPSVPSQLGHEVRPAASSGEERSGSEEVPAGSSVEDEVELVNDPIEIEDENERTEEDKGGEEEEAEKSEELESSPEPEQPLVRLVREQALRRQQEQERARAMRAERERVRARQAEEDASNDKENSETTTRGKGKETGESESPRTRRKRLREEDEAEAEAERERVAREARLRREKSAEAQRQADRRHAAARQAQKDRQEDIGAVAGPSRQAPADPPVSSPVAPTQMTPVAATMLTAPKVPTTARSYVEESDVYKEADVQTPAQQSPVRKPSRNPARPNDSTAPFQPQRPIFPRPSDNTGLQEHAPAPTHAQPRTLPDPLTLGSATKLPPPARPLTYEEQRDGPVRFVPRPRPQKSVNSPTEGHASHSRRAGPAVQLVGPEREASPARPTSSSGQKTAQEDGHQGVRFRSAAAKGDADNREAVEARSAGYDGQNQPAHGPALDGKVEGGGDSWPKINSKIWSFLKYAFLFLVVFSVFTVYWSGAGPRTSQRLTLTSEEYDAFKEFLRNPTNLTPGAREQMESLLPRMIHVQRDRRGKLAIDDEFWHAIKDRIMKDDYVLNMDSQVSGPKWKALLEQIKASAGQPAQPWDDWLKRNKKKLSEAMKEELPSLIKDRLPSHGVTRDEVVREVERVLSQQKAAVQGQVEKIQKSLTSLMEEASRLKPTPHSPQGLTKDEVSKLVDTVVKKAIGNAKLESAAKSKVATRLDEELKGRVNHFAYGNGAQIDISLTSPTWVIPRSSGSYFSWRQPRPPQFVREKFAALTGWDDAGNCWCASILGRNNTRLPADLGIKLGHLVIPEYLVVEHINPSATVDADAMPKDFELWAIVADPARRSRVRDWAIASFPHTYSNEHVARNPIIAQTIGNGFTKIGEFTYQYDEKEGGAHAHRLSRELATSLRASTDQVLVRAVTNYGADHTCFYRIRLYGEIVELHGEGTEGK